MKNNVNSATPSLRKNAIFGIIYQLVQILVPILLIPILSGRLETDGNGSYAFIHSIVMYFSYFALLGVNYYGTKTIAAKKNAGNGEETKYFWIIFIAKALTSSIAIIGYLVFCFVYWSNYFVLFTQLLFLVGNLIDVSWFFMGEENFKSICFRNIFVKSITFILIVIFVKTQNDIGIYSLILGLGEVLNQLFMWTLLFKKRIFKKNNEVNKFTFKDILSSLKGMFIFFIPQLLIEFYTILNTTILGIVSSAGSGSYSEVGIFDYSNKIVSVLTTIAVALGMVFLARASSLNEQNKQKELEDKIKLSLYCSLYISIPLVVGIMGTGHSFIKWFLDGEGWTMVGVLLFFFPIKVIFVAISNTLGVQYLISTGKLKKYILSVGCGALVCVILNLILIKPFGAVGSTISILVAEFTVMLVQSLFVRKEINILSVLKKLWRSYIAAAIMGIFLVIMYLFAYDHICMFFGSIFSAGKPILALADITIIICSALLYFGILFILNDPFLVKFTKRIRILNRIGNVTLSIALYISVFSIVCATSFYTPYNISFSNDISIKKRTICIGISNDNRVVDKNDNCENLDSKFVTILDDEYYSVLTNFNKNKQKGYIYHYSQGTNDIDMVTYNFNWTYCLEKQYKFPIALRYAFGFNDFILNNMNNLVICVDLTNNGNPDNSKMVFISNEEEEISNYFRNKNRSFISVDNSLNIWEKDDLGYIGDVSKDYGYCTVSFFFVDNKIRTISNSLKELNFKQELWFVKK